MSARPAGPDPVFIVGLYKNGTSWLLSALAAHPQFSALRELDVLRSVGGRSGRQLLPRRKRLANVFGRSAFCGLKAEQLAPHAFRGFLPAGETASAGSLYALPPPTAVATLRNMLTAEQGQRPIGADLQRPLVFLNFPSARLEEAFAAIDAARDVPTAMAGFLAGLAPALPKGRRLVLKGADQILCLDALQDYYPRAAKMAIVRDGRDAAVSAFHYRELMREKRMAWHHGHLSYLQPVDRLRDLGIRGVQALRSTAGYGPDWRLGRSMQVWAERVRRVLAAAARGELYVLRYEDLLADFGATFTALLEWLEADADPATVAAVAKASSFQALSGREAGVDAQDVLRKGTAGEWHGSLNARDQALAWRVAGAELTAMGYCRDNEPVPFMRPETSKAASLRG
ncbi:MAG TPA: sulfotransferase domain-containing protein [Gammaproteobacteria bacterium]